MTPFDKEKRGQSESKGASPWHQNHKTRRQQTTPQNANQSIATAKVDRNKKNSKCFKTITHVWKILIPSKAAWFGPWEQNCKQVRPIPAPVHPLGPHDQDNCMLKTWSLDVKNAQNHNGNAQIQTPAKGGKMKKKGGAIKKTKKKCLQKSLWKCTHRAGVKCCNKNVIWLKIQYGGARRNAAPFL